MPPTNDTPQGEIVAAGNLLEFLRWVAARPRTYAETMEAWRTSCPRLSAWEDATGNGLVSVAFKDAPSLGTAGVQLTAQGIALLTRTCVASAPAR